MQIECFLLTWHGSLLCTDPAAGLVHQPVADQIARPNACRLIVESSLDDRMALLLPFPDAELAYESDTLGMGTAVRASSGRGYNFVRAARFLCATGGESHVDWNRDKADVWERFLPVPVDVLTKLWEIRERDWINLAGGEAIAGGNINFGTGFGLALGEFNLDLSAAYPTFFYSQHSAVEGDPPAIMFTFSQGDRVGTFSTRRQGSDPSREHFWLRNAEHDFERESRGQNTGLIAKQTLESQEARYYPPAFAHRNDRDFFFRKATPRRPRLGYSKSSIAILGAPNCHMLLARELEGVLFDDRGVIRCYGYLQACSKLPQGITLEDGRYTMDRSLLDEAPNLAGDHLVFYNGNLQNYYHWLIEGILALYILQKSRGDGAKIVLPSALPRDGGLQYLESIKLFGAARTDLVVTSAPVVRLERAYWIDQSDLIEDVPAHWVVEFQSSVTNSVGRFAQPRRIYVEREEWRTVENADEVRIFLEQAGFITVRLKGLSVLDQARLFSGATFVVGTHGAGLSNLIFAPPSARVIEFMPNSEMRAFFWLISMKLGHEYAMLPCETDSGGFNGKLRVDLHKLGKLLALLENS